MSVLSKLLKFYVVISYLLVADHLHDATTLKKAGSTNPAWINTKLLYCFFKMLHSIKSSIT